MNRMISLSLLFLLTGCSTVKISTSPDGTCTAERTAFFMAASAISGEACGGAIGAANTSADAKALSAIVAAAVSAARVVP